MNAPVDRAAMLEARRLALLRELWRNHGPDGRPVDPS